MKQIYKRLKKAFPFLGERTVTEKDIFEFCVERGIEIVFTPSIREAAYVACEGEHFIFVYHKLTGRRLLHRLCHEIGHYLLHVPAQSRYAVELYGLGHVSRERRECEAETVAALLMIPPQEIHNSEYCGIFKYDIEVRNLFAVRRSYAIKFGK